jgi:hypothetical protein
MPFIIKGKTNWKFILVVAFLAVLSAITVILYAAKQQKFVDQMLDLEKLEIYIGNTTADWQAYENKEYNFELRYPRGWTYKTEENKISFYQSESTQEPDAWEGSFFVSVWDNPEKLGAEEWVAKNVSKVEREFIGLFSDGVQYKSSGLYEYTEIYLNRDDLVYKIWFNKDCEQIYLFYQMFFTFQFSK